jgi:hypothetical protein
MQSRIQKSFLLLGGIIIGIGVMYAMEHLTKSASAGVPAAVPGDTMTYSFDAHEVIVEAGAMEESANPYWWLNSGGEVRSGGGIGMTLFGESQVVDGWGKAYAAANPRDTDQGRHPQNLLRLITRSSWENMRAEAYFRIEKVQMSASPNRNESNGLLLFSRYKDADNLYYAGIRVDGSAVIKKKQNGTYATIAQKPLYADDVPYSRDTNPNLIPGHKWIGLRMITFTNPDDTVYLALFTDRGRTGAWTLALEARDDGKSFGGGAITGAGYAGIRTDFMDVAFDDYRIEKL